MKLKPLTLLFCLFFLIVLIMQSGCSTPMMKASPFYTGEIVYGVSSSGKMLKWNDPEAAGVKKATLNQDAKRFDDDRVNVWPIFYKNFLIYSIVWPIGEINDVGWEIRPLVSIDNYNESYHAMAYMWGYNAKSSSSYLFPAYYMDRKSMFSLLGGWGEDFSYIVPPFFIKNKNYKGDDILSALFPMSRFNLTTGESHVFPAYIRGNDSLYTLLFGWDRELLYIVPPLFLNVKMKSQGKPDEKDNIYFVFWPFAGFNTTREESFVFPLYLDIDKGFYSLLYGYGEKFLYFVPPCFVMLKYPEGNTYNFLWPLCSLTPSKNNYYSFPLFHYSDDKADGNFEFNYLFPLGWGWDNRRASGSMFVPLYFDETTKGNGKRFVLTPLFMANNNFEDFMTPLFGWFKDGKDYYATPFFARNKYNESTDYEIMFPLAKLRIMDKKEEGIRQTQGHVFPFYSYYQDKSGYDLDIMFPFIASGSRRTGENNVEYRRYLPFYYDYSDSGYTHTNYAFFGKTGKNINGIVKSASYILPFYYSRWDKAIRYEIDTAQPAKPEDTGKNAMQQNKKYKEVITACKSTFILPDILFSEDEEAGKYDFSVVPFYFYTQKDKSWITESTFLWLYTRRENLEKKSIDSQALWYLYYYSHQDKTETEQERTTARILWKLYHREKLGDESNFDIFPFISYSENPKRSRFSFCWRLFNYEKTPESLKLNLFFIPILW